MARRQNRVSRPPRPRDTGQHGVGEPSNVSAGLVTVVNAQLDRCAAEISRRSTTQQTIQAGAISATAALGAAVIGGFTPLILLLLPIISVALGSQWLDHHKTIRNIGRYAASELEPALQRHVSSSDAEAPILWEGYLQGQAGRRKDNFLWIVPILTIYYGLPALALAIAVPSALLHPAQVAPPGLPTLSIEVWPRVLWGFGILLLGAGVTTAWHGLVPRTEN